MLSIISKVYERILEKKVKALVEIQLEKPQSGFKMGEECKNTYLR